MEILKNKHVILAQSYASAQDFFELLKPRVMALVIFTSLTGLIVAPGHIHPFIGFVSILALSIGAGASGALNMWYESNRDALMNRTHNRPIPSGRVNSDEALSFGIILSVISVMLMGLAVNWLSAGILAFSIFFYLFIYTIWLKPRTPQNIVIGGAAGALPPVIGYTSVTNNISLDSFLLFLIIFFWTVPHFWALAILMKDDYAKAKIPMLPNVKGIAYTQKQIFYYTIPTVISSILPVLSGLCGMLYLSVAVVLNVGLLNHAYHLLKNPNHARAMFKFSILYLFLIYLSMILEKIFINS